MKFTMIYYFSEKMKIRKVKKLVTNLYDKKGNIVHMHILKTMENVRKHRDINLLRLKQEGIVWCQNRTIMQQYIFGKIYQQIK